MYSSGEICYNDTSCDCFFITDTCNDSITCEYDTRFSSLIGYDSLAEPETRDLNKIIHPDDLERYHSIKSSLSSGNPFESINLRLIKKDRSVICVRCNLIYTTTDDNYERVICAFSLLGDSEYFRQYEELIRSMQPVMFKFRRSEKFPFFYNDSFLKITGYTDDEARTLDLSYTDFMNPRDTDHFLHAIRSADKSGTISACTVRIKSRDNVTRWISCSFKKMTFPSGEVYFIGIGEDITEQKKAEHDLLKNRMLLKNITENLACATFCLNETEDTAELIRANQGFWNLFGYTEDETESFRKSMSRYIIHPDDHSGFIHSIMRTGSGNRNICRAITGSGRTLWVTFGSFRSLEKGNPCYVCTFHDATGLRETECEAETLKNVLAASSASESKILFTVNYYDSTVTFHDIFRQKYGLPSVITGMPDGLFKSGIVHESFRESISSLYYDIKNGLKEGSCTFKHSLPGIKPAWLKADLTAVTVSDGCVSGAVGIISDISDQSQNGETVGYLSREPGEKELMSCAVSLSDSRVIRCRSSIGSHAPVPDNTPYVTFLVTALISCAFPEDRSLIGDMFNIRNMWKNYFEGNLHQEAEFRIKKSGEQYIRVRAEADLRDETSTGSVIMTIGLTDISDAENQTDVTMHDEPMAVKPKRLLSKNSFSALVNEYLDGHHDNGRFHALYILDLNGFMDISRIHGEETGRKILDAVSEALLAVKYPSFAGKMYGDEFMIFVKDIESYDNVNITAKELCSLCRNVSIPELQDETLTGCVGVAFSPAHGEDFDTLYKKAEIAMYSAKRFDRTRYAIYSGEKASDRRQLSLSDFKVRAAETIRNSSSVYHLYNADIRHFRNINHILGYEKGDRILQEICNMLQEFLRPGEFFTRLFADNFLLLTSVHNLDTVLKRMDEINYRLQELHITETSEIQFSAGLVTVDDTNRSAELEQLLDCAIMAHENAKKKEGTSFVNYDPSMNEEEIKKFEILSEIPDAVRNGQICTFVQPQFDIINHEYVSMEALVRWNHPVKGLLTPDMFIDVCEENGLVSSIDFCVLEQMCSYIRSRLDNGLRVLPVAVNQSQITIHERGYVRRLISLVEKYCVPPEYIELEITESACVNNLDETISVLTSLRDYGFRISMDDFGAGYSTLNLLKDIPVDALKIDRAFLTENLVEKKPTEIIRSITSMAHNINIRVVCEGVEFPQQIPFLEKIGCELVQGFLFGRPMPYDQVAAFIDSTETPWPCD